MSESYPSVESLIPHREPMRLLQRIVGETDDGGLICIGQISASHPLAGPAPDGDGKVASSMLGIELAAQAAAVLEGILTIRATEGPFTPRIGYLVGLRGCHLNVPHLPVDRSLVATIHPSGRASSMAVYKIRVCIEDDGTELLTGTVNTWLTDQLSEGLGDGAAE